MFNGFHHLFNHRLLILSVTCKSTDPAHFFLRIYLKQHEHRNDNFELFKSQVDIRNPLRYLIRLKYFDYSIGFFICSISSFSPTDISRSDCVHEQVAKQITNVRFTNTLCYNLLYIYGVFF